MELNLKFAWGSAPQDYSLGAENVNTRATELLSVEVPQEVERVGW